MLQTCISVLICKLSWTLELYHSCVCVWMGELNYSSSLFHGYVMQGLSAGLDILLCKGLSWI